MDRKISVIKNYVLPIIILTLVIVFVFRELPKTFYQQDEWYGLGLSFANGMSSAFNGVSGPIDVLFAKGRIIASLIFYFIANYFPLENSYFSVLAIALHIVGTSLVFVLIKRFVKNNILSFFGASLFAVNAVSHGSVTWSAVSASTIGSSIFVLLGILFFFRYLDKQKPKLLLLTGGMIYFSLWFKETGLYMFIFLPFAALLFKKYSFQSFVRTFWAFILPFLLIVGYRVIELRLRATPSNLYITGMDENFLLTILIRAILYPLTSFSLMFVPGDHFLEFAREVLRNIYPFFANSANNILIAQTVILDLLAVVLTLILLGIVLFFIQKEKSKGVVIFWLMFCLSGFLPYVVLAKDFSYLESRYYYLPMAGGAFLFSWLLKRLNEVFGKKIFFVLIVPISFFYILFHANVVQGAISEQVRLGNVRKDFITQLENFVPTLNKEQNVFYIAGNQNYWADGNKIPFQQGTGYTLMVLYYDSGKIPKEFLKEEFLSEIGSQGYKEVSEFGFGYFGDKEELDKAIELYKLSDDTIISLYYNSEEKKLVQIEEND